MLHVGSWPCFKCQSFRFFVFDEVLTGRYMSPQPRPHRETPNPRVQLVVPLAPALICTGRFFLPKTDGVVQCKHLYWSASGDRLRAMLVHS